MKLRACPFPLLAAGLLSGWLLGAVGCEEQGRAGRDGVPGEEGIVERAGGVDGSPPARERDEREEKPVGGGEEPEAPRPEGDEAAQAEVTPGEKTAPTDEDSPVPVPATESAPEPAKPGGEAEAVEAWTPTHAGFAAKLPPEVDLYLDGRKLGWIWKLIKEAEGNDLIRKFLSETFAGSGMELESEDEDFRRRLEVALPAILEQEIFVAARGLEMPAEALIEISQAANRTMGRDLVKALASGEIEDVFIDGFGSAMPREFSAWLQSNVKKLEGEPKLALMVGCRLEDKVQTRFRNELAAVLQEAVDESEELEQARWEAGDVSWSGYEFSAQELPSLIGDSPPEGLDEDTWAEIEGLLGKHKVVVACAEVDEYLVLAAGLGREAFALAESPESSLAATEPFQFFRKFDANAVRGTTWARKAVVKAVIEWNRGLPVFEGIEKGLQDSPQLRRRDRMVRTMKEFLTHLRARAAGTASHHVGVVLDGEELRYEARGGWLGVGLDYEAPLEFARAFAPLEDETFVRAHWKMEQGHVAHGHKQVDAAMQLLRQVGNEVMERLAEGQADDAERTEQMARWKRDLGKGLDDLRIGYSEHFSKAFGEEWAFVMDLEGEMIPAVGVEEEVVEKGRIPRASLVRPVVKRAALSESWEMWQAAITNLFGIVAESVDQPIPFPDTMSAEKDDLRTHFFPLPFASDDFLPSVSVSDDLFMMGTSKTLSEKLYTASLAPREGPEESGLLVEMNTGPLWEFCDVWLEVYEERRAARKEMLEDDLGFGGPAPILDSPDPEVLRLVLGKLRALQTVRYRRWVEEGVPRASLRMSFAQP